MPLQRNRIASTMIGIAISIAIHSVGNLALTWDHRAFDGAYAAAFLAAVRTTLETRDWAEEVGPAPRPRPWPPPRPVVAAEPGGHASATGSGGGG